MNDFFTITDYLSEVVGLRLFSGIVFSPRPRETSSKSPKMSLCKSIIVANHHTKLACLVDLKHKVMFYHTMSMPFCLLESTQDQGCDAWAIKLYSTMYLIRGF